MTLKVNRLLVLDDEPGILEAYRFILEPIGETSSPTLRSSRSQAVAQPITQTAVAPFQVSYAKSGEEALLLIEESMKQGTPYCGGFFDVKLGPGIDGLQTIQKAREIDPNLLYVVVTAYQDRTLDDITKLFGEDFSDRWDFLAKPFSQNEILQKARNLVSNWERRRREKEYIDEIKKTQAQLLHAERLAAVGTLARGIGHEFGNVLVRIIGRADIARQSDDPNAMKDSLKIISTAANRAGAIVRNLQSLVRMEVKREICDIREPMREALDLVEFELKKAQVTVSQDFPPVLPKLKLSRTELEQVFLNLFINSIHAMDGCTNAQLRLRGYSERGGVHVEISDTGSGIDKEHLEHIFEPLFTTKGEKGSGIGLSVSRKIVVNHGGKIGVKSEVGKGTTFHLWLPEAQI